MSCPAGDFNAESEVESAPPPRRGPKHPDFPALYSARALPLARYCSHHRTSPAGCVPCARAGFEKASAEATQRDAARESRDARNEAREAVDELEPMSKMRGDFGADGEWHALYGTCIKTKIQQYDYEVCPFKTAKQDFVKLGDWKGWADGRPAGAPPRMRFTGGQYCSGAGARELEVDMLCGAEDAIPRSTSPRRAVLRKMTSPAAC